MEGTKPFWASKTAWASLVQIMTFGLLTLGLVDQHGVEVLNEQAPELAVTLVGVVTGAFALYGRVKATKAIA